MTTKKPDNNKDGVDEDDFEQGAGQLKGDVRGDQNKSHLEKEEKLKTKKEKQMKVKTKKKTRLIAARMQLKTKGITMLILQMIQYKASMTK